MLWPGPAAQLPATAPQQQLLAVLQQLHPAVSQRPQLVCCCRARGASALTRPQTLLRYAQLLF
jgi:hypothetical protein